VARNYAETFLALADRSNDAEAWIALLGEVASLYRDVPDFRALLETPRISEEEKQAALREVLGGRYPELFVRFMLVVLQKRRQSMLPDMESAARELLDERTGRVTAAVTLSIEVDAELRQEIEAALGRVLGRQVSADFRLDRRLLGGMVVRVKDQVMDGSLRRRMQLMRRTLIEEA
jgi:F-type H+-transporting ATPase subunit delta